MKKPKKENLHLLHGDPSAIGQYAHCLRGPDDDFGAGDAAALMGTRELITELVVTQVQPRMSVARIIDGTGDGDLEIGDKVVLK